MATNTISYTKHAVCESSKLKATKAGHILNLKAHADLDNGSLVKKGDFVSDEYYISAAPATTDKVYLVLTVPEIYEEYVSQMQNEYNFYNAKDSLMRAYELYPDDIFTLSTEGFSGVPAVGKYVVADGAKAKIVDAVTTEAFVGKIIEKASNGNYRVEVIKNA